MRLAYSVVMAAALVGLGSAGALAAEPTATHFGRHMHSRGFWWICPALFLFMVVFCMVAFSRRFRIDPRRPFRWRFDPRGSEGGVSAESAFDILDKRYAWGDIDKEEYEATRSTILSAGQ